MRAMSSRMWFAIAVVAAVGCKHHVDAGYFGKHVQPPHGLEVLRPGMSMAEARAKVPGIDESGHVPSGVDDLELEVQEGDGRVEHISAVHRGGLDKLLETCTRNARPS
jgi:hypothetical protein